jgi:outer membrane biosynthesis protein TonB
MKIPVDNPIFLARQQEQQKLPKILACGIGGSLVFHGIAAVAFNYLPQQASVPIEVTLIDPNEIPADLKPSPAPTITPPHKVKPTPALVAKTTPTPTPSVKITPTPTPQIIKIVTKPVEPVIPVQEMPKKLTPNDFNQQQELASVPFQENNDRQSQTDSVTQPNKINNADSTQRMLRDQDSEQRQSSPSKSNPGNLSNSDRFSSEDAKQFSSGDATRSNKMANLFSTESNSSAGNGLNQSDNQFNDAGNPGRRDSNQGSSNLSPSRNSTTGTGGNSQPLIAGRTGSQSFDRFGGNSGSSGSPTGGEGDEFATPYGGGGSRSNSGGSSGVNGQGINGQSLASGRTGGRLTGLTGDGGRSVGDSDSSGIVLIPGGSGGGSRSNSGGTGGTGGNGSSLTAHRTGKPGGGFGNGSGISGDGDGLAQDGTPGTNISRSGGVIQTSKGFGSGLECLANCQPSYPQEVEYEAIVAVSITLDDRGQVIATKLFKPSKNKDLNNFAQTEFGRMQFRLPANVTRRNFPVQMKFKETR